MSKRHKSANEDLSLSEALRASGKSNEAFEVMLSALTLEELIGLKIECASRLTAGKMYGFKLWYSTTKIIKEAVFKAVISLAHTNIQAIRILGISLMTFNLLRIKYDIQNSLSYNTEYTKD